MVSAALHSPLELDPPHDPQLAALAATTILFPAVLPYMLTGVRLAVGTAWLVIVAAEMLTGGVGIGFWVWDEWNNLNVKNIIIAICSIWPMVINTAVGVQRVPQDYMNVARVLNLSEWKIATTIQFPAVHRWRPERPVGGHAGDRVPAANEVRH